MNVVINQAAVDLSAAGDHSAAAFRLIARRDVLSAADLAIVRQKIMNCRACLDRVETEINAPRTGLTIPHADWNDRNEIAAERAAKGIA